MEIGNRQIKLTQDLFEPVKRSARDAEELSGPRLASGATLGGD